ncbi:MAG: FKBP-type peptidyl-prolyl cis-trans isomerase [Crocinitomicaceae bacterium]|nr:FKBP-type peptidyl-prolyl cis-trans isomerase [Crocinitomicaceae bacterium]
MRNILIITLILSIVSCEISAVKDVSTENSEDVVGAPSSKTSSDTLKSDKSEPPVIDKKVLTNGIEIKWFTHGNGVDIQDGDMVEIDYKVSLEDGKIVDGNHLLKHKSFPFMVGFNMQTEGWDLALNEMRVGDHAEIFIPSELARGEKGIKGLIPPNANNILNIKCLSKKEPGRTLEGGTRVWLMREELANTNRFNKGKKIIFHSWVSSTSNPRYYNTENVGRPISYEWKDEGLTPGLKKALLGAKRSDLMLVHVPSSEAYGVKGFKDLVKPNEDLLYRIWVMDIEDK